MLNYQQCLKDNLEALTQLVMLETGKIYADAKIITSRCFESASSQPKMTLEP